MKEYTALQIYGVHLDDCPCYIPPGRFQDNDHHTKTDAELVTTERDGIFTTVVKCTCGFYEALDREKKRRSKDMDKEVCRTCAFWGKERDGDDSPTVDARGCELEPFDVRNMKITDCAVMCGHDGGIYYGAEFGCNRWEAK